MNRWFAEFVATFFLVLIGTGSIVLNEYSGGKVMNSGIALSSGAVVALMIWIFGRYSGAHMNPAVSLSLSVAGFLEKKLLLIYFLLQFGGAICASLLLQFLFPFDTSLGITQPELPLIQSFILEFAMSMILMLVILFVGRLSGTSRILQGVAIGAVIGLEVYFGGPYSGASMNPIRSIAPALISGKVQHLWLYIAAPISGMLFATFFWKLQMNRLIRHD